MGSWVGRVLLFSETSDTDATPPWMTVRLPVGAIFERLPSWTGMGKHSAATADLIGPSIPFWIALLNLFIVGACFSTLMSCMMHSWIILPSKQQNRKPGQPTGFLVGFGLLMPLCAAFPYYGVQYFAIRNKIHRFLFCLGPLTTFFRCPQAVFGFLPAHVDESLTNMILFNMTPLELPFDANGPLRASWKDVYQSIGKFVVNLLVIGAYCSYLTIYAYEPYPTRVDSTSLEQFFSYPALMNSFLAALLFQMYLSTYTTAFDALINTVGYRVVPTMNNPLFSSTSPGDFWGKKWNMAIHGMLKRGVYKPVRTRFPRLVASLATFISSGLFHEYMLMIIFLPDGNDQTNEYTPVYGRSCLFFVWNATLIACEHAFGGMVIFGMMKKTLPVPLVSILVVLTALPATHLFVGDYVKSDFFENGQIGFPMIKMVDTS